MSAVICETTTEWNKENKCTDVSIVIYNYTSRARSYTILATWPEKSGAKIAEMILEAEKKLQVYGHGN